MLEKCGSQIWFCLFVFQRISLAWLQSIIMFSWLGGWEITLQIAVWEVPGSIPGSGKAFIVPYLFVVVVVVVVVFLFYFLSKKYYLQNILQFIFAMLNSLSTLALVQNVWLIIRV